MTGSFLEHAIVILSVAVVLLFLLTGFQVTMVVAAERWQRKKEFITLGLMVVLLLLSVAGLLGALALQSPR